MVTDLAGLSVFLTGASGGIGRAIARAFFAEGCQLALGAHTRVGELERLARAEGWAERALLLECDVSDAHATQAAFDAARARFGRIDVVVACAGVWPRADEALHTMSLERLERTVAVNLMGAVHTLRAFAKGLAEDGPRADGRGASAVLIGSTAARFGERDHSDYSLAKAGLYGLLASMAVELPRLDPFARVNLVEPGWTVTEMAREALADDRAVERVAATLPLRQLARAEDVARAVVVLASPALSRHVTGQTLTVAGGMQGRLLWSADQLDAAAIRQRSAPGGA